MPRTEARPSSAAPRRVRRSLVLVHAAVAAALLTACGGAPPPIAGFVAIESTFDASTEGWTSSEAEAPAWEAPGVLTLVDAAGGWYHAIAPDAFHGDWTGAGTVGLRVRADAGGVVYPLRLVVTGGGETIVHEFALEDLEAGVWRTLAAPLQASAWTVYAGERTEGAQVDATTFAAVLADVTDFRVRVDLNDRFTGDEVNQLDDVRVY